MGNTLFMSANWYAARSADGGNTFTYVSPYTTFPNINGGFCCDQIVNYARNQDMMLWALQYIKDGSSGTLRIARAVGSAAVLNNTWVYYDFNPQLFGIATGNWMDFPNLTIGSTFLYATSNVFRTSDNGFTGCVIWRIPLSELAAGGSISFSYLVRTDVGNLRCTEGASTTMYWAAFANTSTLRIHRWDDGSGSVFWDDVALNPFTYLNRDGVSTTPDGRNWAARCDSRVLGATVTGGVLAFMWGAKQDGTFPQPYTIVARFSQSTRALLSQQQVWNSAYAWLYMNGSVNSAGAQAGLIAYGGGPFYPNTAFWINDDVESGFIPLHNYAVADSTAGPSANAWGDFLTSRPHKDYTNSWVAVTYYMTAGGGNANTVGRFMWIGRQRDLPQPCTPSPINFGQTINGSLSTLDCRSPARGGQYYADQYTFSGTAGQGIAITMSSSSFDTYLYLKGTTGSYIASDDDGGGGTNSRIPALSGFFTLPTTGTYTIETTSFDQNTTGNYSVGLVVSACPTVTSINPTSGPAGTSVVITGSNFTGVTAVKFTSNVTASFTVNSDTQITTTAAAGGVTGPITISKTGCADVQTGTFTYTACPTVSGINPTSGPVGSSVVITGNNFSGVTAVRFFNNIGASFTINGNTQITATVPAAQTGPITIVSSGCPDVQTGTFTVTTCPVVSTINPTSGPVGTNVVITGNNFTGVTGVKFSNNVTASFTVNSNTQITTTVPAGAVNGPITISKTNCTDVQTGTFTVTGCTATVPVSIPTNLSGGSGSTLIVPINVGSSLTGLGVTSYDFVLTFNSSLLSPASPAFDTAGTLSNGFTITPNTGVSGQITVSAFGTTALSGSGTLLNLRFTLTGAAGACSNLTWASFKFNEGSPCAATSNGQACVTNNFISGTVSYCVTPGVKVPGVTLTAAGTPSGMATTATDGTYTILNLGSGNYTVTPTKTGAVNGISSFDASQVAQHVAGLITLSSCQQLAGDASNNGSLSSFDASLIAQTVAGISNPGIAGTWKFVPTSRSYTPLSGGLTGQNYDAVLVGDVSGNWVAAGPVGERPSPSPISVSLSESSAATFGDVTMRVIVGDLSSREVLSYDFTLEYDTDALQLQNPAIEIEKTLSKRMIISANSATPGRLIISAFGARPLSGSGTLLNITFKVIEGANAGASTKLQNFIFNEGTPAVKLVSSDKR